MTQSDNADHDHAVCIARVLDKVVVASAEGGTRFTPVRRRALEILLESHTAIGAYDLLKRLNADGFGAQPPVAYRALDFLVEQGFAHKIESLNAFVACMRPREGHDPALMICRACRSVAETAADPGLDKGAGKLGFTVETRVVEIGGLCPQCQATSA